VKIGGGGMGKFHPAAKIAKPPSPMKIKAPQSARIRLPQGNTGQSDPGPYLPGVGKL
jgi:hypothetical protein